MPRPRNLDRPIEKKISLPSSLVQAVEERSKMRTASGAIRYGAWRDFIEKLLRDYLKSTTKEGDDNEQ